MQKAVISAILALLLCVPAFSQDVTLREEQEYAFAMGLFRDGNYQLAFEKFRAFAETWPRTPQALDAQYYAAEALYQAGNLTDAALRFERFFQEHPESALADDAAFRDAETAFRQGHFSTAFERFSHVVRTWPEGSMAHEAAYWAGESAFRAGDNTGAMKYYRIAYEHYPEGTVRDYAWFSTGYVLEREKKYEEALERYEDFLRSFPASTLVPAAATRKGACMHELGDETGALSWLEGLGDSPDPENAAERLYLRGECCWKLGRYGDAEKHYRSFLSAYQDNPRAPQVAYALGWACIEQKKFTEAVAIFDELGKRGGPMAEAARYRKGMALRLAGNAEAATQVFQEMLREAPRGEYADNAEFELGMTAYDAKAYRTALTRFTTVTDSFPSSDVLADAWYMRGETAIALGSFAEAVTCLRAALAVPTIQPRVQAGARFRLGFALFQSGAYADAAECYRAFLKEQPADSRKAEALVWLGESCLKAGAYEDAVIAYQQALSLNPGPGLTQDALYGLGWTQFRAQNFVEAETAFRRLTQDFRGGPHDPDAAVRLGDAQYARKRFAEAVASYRYAARMYPSHALAPYALLQQGAAENRAGDVPAAMATLRGLLEKYPRAEEAAAAQFSLAWLFFQSKDYAAAIPEFEKVIASYPGSPLAANARYSIGDCWYNLGKYQKAEQSYRAVLAEHPTAPAASDALDGVAQSLRMQGRPQEAERVRAEWLSAHPQSTVAEDDEYRTALAADPRDPGAQIAALEVFLANHPKSAHAQEATVRLGRLQRGQSDYRRAEETLRAAVVMDPGSAAAVDARFELAETALAQQDRNKAVAIYSELLTEPAARGRRAETLLRRGRAQRSAKRFDAAREDFLAAEALEPPDAFSAQAGIEHALLDAAQGSPDSALARLEAIAVNTRGETGACAQYHIGDLHFQQGRYDAAIEALLRVGYVYPDGGEWNAQALLLLGRSYDASAQRAKAKETYRKVVDQYEGTEQAREARTLLKEMQ